MSKTKRPDYVPDWKEEGVNGRIREADYNAILQWLKLPDGEARIANHHLLTHGLEESGRGTIKSATFQSNPERFEVIAEAKRGKGNTPTTYWNTARVFDMPAFALMRLLTAFGGRYRMNDHEKGNALRPGQTLLFPAVNLGYPSNVSLARLIWGSTTPSTVKQIEREDQGGAASSHQLFDTYHDWRLVNLHSKDAKPKRRKPGSTRGKKPRDRKAAIKAALAYRKSREALRVRETSRNEKRSNFVPKATEYKWALDRCFALLDEIKATVLLQRDPTKS